MMLIHHVALVVVGSRARSDSMGLAREAKLVNYNVVCQSTRQVRLDKAIARQSSATSFPPLRKNQTEAKRGNKEKRL